MTTTFPTTLDGFKSFGQGSLPGLVGVEILTVDERGVESRLQVRADLMAPNGFLHAASVIALADTSCGYGCVRLLPEGARGFTTIELKANFLGTAREGAIRCRATPRAPGAYHAGVGCGGRHRGEREADSPVPVHPDGFMAESPTMTRRFFGFFFYFPCLLADGTG